MDQISSNRSQPSTVVSGTAGERSIVNRTEPNSLASLGIEFYRARKSNQGIISYVGEDKTVCIALLGQWLEGREYGYEWKTFN